MFMKCIQCGKYFDLSEAEKQFYEEKGLELPKRCKMCRQSNRIRKNDVIVPRGKEKRQNRRNAIKAVPVTTLLLLIGLTFLLLQFFRGGQYGQNTGTSGDRQNAATRSAVEESYSSSIEKGIVFRNDKLLMEHFEKHGKDMGFGSPEEYLAGANAVVHNSDALHKTEQEDGDDVYYVRSTNDLVIVSVDGYIRTYFRPEDGAAYYDRQ